MNQPVTGKNIVFVGNFQPSKYDKLFFVKSGIIKEEDILDSSVFNSDIVQMSSYNVHVLIINNQIVINSLDNESEKLKQLARVFLDISKQDITALGINFTWNKPVVDSLEADTKKLFFNDNNKILSNSFTNEDAVFGSYASKNFRNGRLKLEIKPQILKGQGTRNEFVATFINYAFNFHYDLLNGQEKTVFSEALEDFDILFQETIKIMSVYE